MVQVELNRLLQDLQDNKPGLSWGIEAALLGCARSPIFDRFPVVFPGKNFEQYVPITVKPSSTAVFQFAIATVDKESFDPEMADSAGVAGEISPAGN